MTPGTPARRVGLGAGAALCASTRSPAVAPTCEGQAASSAAVLLAGRAGRRMVLPHARLALHQPSAREQGALPDLALQAKQIVRLRAEMEAILSRHTDQSVERIREDTGRDLVLSAADSAAYGLVDGILERRKDETVEVGRC